MSASDDHRVGPLGKVSQITSLARQTFLRVKRKTQLILNQGVVSIIPGENEPSALPIYANTMIRFSKTFSPVY